MNKKQPIIDDINNDVKLDEKTFLAFIQKPIVTENKKVTIIKTRIKLKNN